MSLAESIKLENTIAFACQNIINYIDNVMDPSYLFLPIAYSYCYYV